MAHVHPTRQLLCCEKYLEPGFSLTFHLFVPFDAGFAGVLLHNSCLDGDQCFALEILPGAYIRFKSSYGLDMCSKMEVAVQKHWSHVTVQHWLDAGGLRARMFFGRLEVASCHVPVNQLVATHGVPSCWKQSGAFSVGISSGWHRCVQVCRVRMGVACACVLCVSPCRTYYVVCICFKLCLFSINNKSNQRAASSRLQTQKLQLSSLGLFSGASANAWIANISVKPYSPADKVLAPRPHLAVPAASLPSISFPPRAQMQVLYFVGVLSRILPYRVGSKVDGASARNAMKLNQSRIPFSFPYEQVADKLSSIIFGGFVSVPVQVACLGCLGICLSNLESERTRIKLGKGGDANKPAPFSSVANIVRFAFWTLGSLLRRRDRSSGALCGLTSALGRFLCGVFAY